MEIKFKNVTFSSKIGLKDRDYVSYFYSKKQGQFLIFPMFSTSTRNPDHKKRSKKWSSLNRACFVQSFLIFQPPFGLVFLVFLRVSSRFLLFFLLLLLLMCRKTITKWAMAKKLANL